MSDRWARTPSSNLPETTPPILVVDALGGRGVEVVRAMRAGGVQSRRLRWLTVLPEAGAAWSRVAVVGLPGDSSSTAAPEWLRRAASAGFRPICYGDGASRWPLRDRCRLLLAGATHILDSAEADFLTVVTRMAGEQAAADSRQRAEQRELRQLMVAMGIVGESAAMRSIFRWVRRISQLSDLLVLLTGETGTGKELLARAIHRLDPKRSCGPFVALNCNALSASLAESELFGHRSGAFTGAVRDRKGLFRSAHGGVLLLDEIGDLDLTLQGKLLRALQENAVLSVGEDIEAPVDVRVIAATNRDLEKMVREGLFREDLYQRISILVVRVPPLRERPEDLRPLAEHFVRRHAAVCGVPEPPVAEDFLEAVRLSGLPGNGRQLENLIRSALLKQEDDSPLGLVSLAPEFWQLVAERARGIEMPAPSEAAEVPAPALSRPLTHFLESEEATLAAALQQCERILLQQALHKARGNQTRAARLLGVTPRSVYNKLRKHKLIA